MASPALPPARDSYRQPMPWKFHRVVQALNALGTLWIVLLMVLINTDVLGRNLFDAPVRGVTEPFEPKAPPTTGLTTRTLAGSMPSCSATSCFKPYTNWLGS